MLLCSNCASVGTVACISCETYKPYYCYYPYYPCYSPIQDATADSNYEKIIEHDHMENIRESVYKYKYSNEKCILWEKTERKCNCGKVFTEEVFYEYDGVGNLTGKKIIRNE